MEVTNSKLERIFEHLRSQNNPKAARWWRGCPWPEQLESALTDLKMFNIEAVIKENASFWNEAFMMHRIVAKQKKGRFKEFEEATLQTWIAHARLCAHMSQLSFSPKLRGKLPSNGPLHAKVLTPVSYHFDSPYGVAVEAVKSNKMTLSMAALSLSCLHLVLRYYKMAPKYLKQLQAEAKTVTPTLLATEKKWLSSLVDPASSQIAQVQSNAWKAIEILHALVDKKHWSTISELAEQHIQDIGA